MNLDKILKKKISTFLTIKNILIMLSDNHRNFMLSMIRNCCLPYLKALKSNFLLNLSLCACRYFLSVIFKLNRQIFFFYSSVSATLSHLSPSSFRLLAQALCQPTPLLTPLLPFERLPTSSWIYSLIYLGFEVVLPLSHITLLSLFSFFWSSSHHHSSQFLVLLFPSYNPIELAFP